MAAEHVLLVDDNELESRLVSFLLKDAGFIVEIAASAERALEVLRTFEPQLILLELHLPGMDGVEFTKRLRADRAYRSTIIVALTAYTVPSELERAREAGCSGHISKPIDTAGFAQLVREFLKGTRVDLPGDSHDLLAETRNTFLAKGLEQCDTILNELRLGPARAPDLIRRTNHRWASLGGTLGFPEISEYARRVEKLLTQGQPEKANLKRAIEIAQRRFGMAALAKPELPEEMVRGLAGLRIGLVDFSEDEGRRIRSVSNRARLQLLVDPVSGDAIDKPLNFDALVVNARPSTLRLLHLANLPIPAVFIGPRSLLKPFSKLTAAHFDFLFTPWDVEEVLLRVFRLIAKPPEPPPPQESTETLEKRRPRVLVVDDDPDMVALIAEALRQFQMDCEIAYSGKEALDTVRRGQPDAIILDVNMLDMDGFEVLKRLRRNLITEDLPVLMLTGRSQVADVARGYKDGANAYMIKPFQAFELGDRLTRMIAAYRQAHARPAARSIAPVLA
jgi:CheY-like chemotaxis protein